jgi:capsular exopolysaccharide synthesis family protein
METRHYSIALRRWWWIVAVSALVGTSLGWGLSHLVKPSYTATSQVFISLAQGNTAGELANGASYNQQQMASYAELATAPVVLDPVISSLSLPTTSTLLAKAVTVTIPQGTTILQIAVTDPSSVGSAKIANAIAEEVGVAIVDVSPRTTSGAKNVLIRTIAPATPPTSPSAPKTALNTLLGLVGGVLVGLAIVFLRARYDNRIRSRADLVAATDAPVLASVVAGSAKRKSQVRAMLDSPVSAAAESYRQLRADLQFVGVDQQHAIFVVTSALPREGKSTVVCNLALAIAEAGVPVLVIDSDLRRPSVATFFGLEGDAGLTTVLSGRATFADVVQRWGGTTLDVLASGAVPPNPSELLSSQAMVKLVESVGRAYDVVLIDSPPTLTIADAVIVARIADGALVVVDATQARRPHVQQAVGSLRSSGVEVLGTVLNRVRPDRTGDAYYQQ